MNAAALDDSPAAAGRCSTGAAGSWQAQAAWRGAARCNVSAEVDRAHLSAMHTYAHPRAHTPYH